MTSRSTRRRVLVGATAAGVSAYLLYRAYRSDSYRRFREAVAQLQKAGADYSAAALAGADVSAGLLRDLRYFLQSESAELPNSLRQLAKIAQSEDVTRAAAAFTSAVLRGAHSSHSADSPLDGDAASQPTPDVLERVLTALTSEHGQSLVGLAVSVACRSGVEALLESWARAPESPGVSGGVHLHVESLAGHFGQSLAEQRAASGGWLQTMLDWAGSPGGERVVLNAIGTFVRQGTQVYMQSFGDANMWDDILAAAGNPQHRHATEHLTRVFVNEVISSWFAKPATSRAATPSMPSPHSARLRSQHQHTITQPLSEQQRNPLSCSEASDCSLAGCSDTCSDAASPVAGVDLDSAFDEEGIATCKPPPLGSSRLQGRTAFHASNHSGANQAVNESSTTSWSSTIFEVVKKPEARSLILAMTPIVVAEGVRSGLFCGRDLLFRTKGRSLTGQAHHSQSLQLPSWMLGFVALLIMCWLAMQLPTFSYLAPGISVS